MAAINRCDFLVSALAPARAGLRVLPLKPNSKTALVCEWRAQATTDEPTIRAWAERWPSANVGVVTGDGFLVVDIDPRHGGDVSLAAVERKHGPLPMTVTAETGGGGLHLFFRTPAGVAFTNTRGALPGGIDVRGNGGYVVAAGSVHPSGGVYRWRDGCGPGELPMADAPTWLVGLIQAKATTAGRLKDGM